MPPSNKPRKHHFVPRCYLSGFTENGHLYAVNITNVKKGYQRQLLKNTPTQICYELDYYTVSDDLYSELGKGTNFDSFFIEEKVLTSYESKFPKILKALLEDRQLILKDAVWLSDFIIQLKLRNPYWLKNTINKNLSDWLDKASSAVKEDLEKEERYQRIPSEIKNFLIKKILEDSKNEKFAKRMQLTSLLKRFFEDPTENTKTRNAIVNCEWSLFESPPLGPFFITSDNPGFSYGNDNLVYDTRFTNGFAYHLPLTSKFCLLICDNLKDNSLYKGEHIKTIKSGPIPAQMVIEINNRSIQNVNKFIVGADEIYLTKVLNANLP